MVILTEGQKAPTFTGSKSKWRKKFRWHSLKGIK